MSFTYKLSNFCHKFCPNIHLLSFFNICRSYSKINLFTPDISNLCLLYPSLPSNYIVLSFISYATLSILTLYPLYLFILLLHKFKCIIFILVIIFNLLKKLKRRKNFPIYMYFYHSRYSIFCIYLNFWLISYFFYWKFL